MLKNSLRGGLLSAVAVVLLGGAIAAPVLGQDASSGASAGAAAAPAAAPDILAAGKHLWNDAACYNCHGPNGEGGHSADFPAGPSLRTSGLDPQSMLTIVECGVAGSRMPAWLKGAYTQISCYGAPVGAAPADTLVSGAYSEADLKNLVAYVQTTFMKQPLPKW